MKLKGAYSGSVSYNVGDVVKYTDGQIYHLQHPASSGTPPTDTLFWGMVDQQLAQAILMVLDGVNMAVDGALTGKVANNLTTTAAGKVLDARQGKALKDLIDTQGEAVGGLQTDVGTLKGYFKDAKTLVLASSTAESTKKFAITVDDDGELSATEIVEETPAAEEET